MKILQILSLAVAVFTGCHSSQEQAFPLFDSSYSVNLPEGMKKCEGFDSVPDYLNMLYNLKTQKSYLFQSDSSYFSAMIVEIPCENETDNFIRFSDEFASIFSQAYPSSVFNEGISGGTNGLNFHYRSFKIEFSFATYSIFYVISSYNGNLLYINYLEQGENIEAVEERGIKIMKSLKQIEG